MKLRKWQDFIPEFQFPLDSIHVDLGAGRQPRNPLRVPNVIATDIHIFENPKHKTIFADLTRPLPFDSNTIQSFSAFDVLEHIPRWERTDNGQVIFPFVSLMSEIFRCLKPGGFFIALTPAIPSPIAFQDPTHINFVTKETLDLYFSGDDPWATSLGYGFKGNFKVLQNDWKEGDAILESTTEFDARKANSAPKERLRKFVRSHKGLLMLSRFFRGLDLRDNPSHLLWVVQKPFGEASQ
jgi:SAM-dependent methyltransferase